MNPFLSTVTFRGLVAAAFVLLAFPIAAQTAAQAPTSGFVDPAGAKPRAPLSEADLVYRGPSVDTLATVRKRGVLRIGVVVGEPMVLHDKQGALAGYAIDIGRRLGEDLGVSVAFVETSWESVLPELLERRIDLVAADFWVTPQRALVVNFSGPIALEGIHVVASRGRGADRKTMADFDKPEVRIGVYGGSVQERVTARMFPHAALVRIGGDDDPMKPLLDGRADAVVVPTLAPDDLLSAAPGRLYLPFDKPLSATMSALAIRKGDPDFLTYLNTWLDVQRHAGWLAERTKFWLESTD